MEISEMKAQVKIFFSVSRQTVQDWLREKLLYNIFFVSLFLMFFSYLAAFLVYGRQDRVVLHFGMLVNALSILGVAISTGARGVRQEFEQRTGYLVWTRPVSRVAYFFGKWAGIWAFLLLNLTLLTGVLWGALWLTDGKMTYGLLQAMGLLWIEGGIASAFALLMSLWLRPGLSGMLTFSFLFVSHNHDQIRFISEKAEVTGGLLGFLMNATPDAQALLLDTRVYYEIPLSAADWWLRMAYGLGWALIFVFLGNAFFFRKNL
jgi:ABC-type transport system involved in multi-copper enzyme maturation permease subunit